MSRGRKRVGGRSPALPRKGTPKGDPPDLRPLTARALRSVMDTLRPHFAGARVLDLYSGKGRFGLSALEEGAASVVFVEKHRPTAMALGRLAERWGEAATVVNEPVESCLARRSKAGETFDVVFADPPFRLWDETYAGELFAGVKGVLGDGSIFLVRYPKRMLVSLPVEGLQRWKSTVFGESELLYLVS